MTERTFSQEELLSFNRDNFKRLFELRGLPYFPCNKTPAELVKILFAHQYYAFWLTTFDDNDDKYTDKELKERQFTENELQKFNHHSLEKNFRLK